MSDRLQVERRYWTAKEAAAYIGVHVLTLYRYCTLKKPGRVPPFRIFGSRTYRFPIHEFKAWAERGNEPPMENH